MCSLVAGWVWGPRSGGSVAESGVDERPLALPRAAGRHGKLDPPHRDADQRTDLEQLQPDRPAGRFGELRVREPDPAQGTKQHVSHRREPQPELVGSHGPARGPVSEQVGLALLYAVPHVAAGAIDLLVEMARSGLLRLERGDHEARVAFALRPLGLRDHPAPARPRVQRRPEEVLEAPRRPAARLRRGSGLRQLGRDPGLEALVARQAEHVIDPVLLAPCHQRLTSEAGVGAQKNAHARPTARTWAIMRAISSTAPALPSMLERLSLAQRRWRSQ